MGLVMYTVYPDGLNSTILSQGCVLGAASSVSRAGGMYIPRMQEGLLIAQVQLRVNQWSCPLNGLPQQKEMINGLRDGGKRR